MSLITQISIDEFEKCEVCYEEFDDNEYGNKPYCLFPCGHTFCIMCLNSLNESKCPKCKAKIEQKATNWSVIHHINKFKYTPEKLKKMEEKMLDLEKELDEKKTSIHEFNTKRINELITKLNDRETYLLEKLKIYKQELVDTLNERLKKNKEEIKENEEKDKNEDKKQLAQSYFDDNGKLKENHILNEVKSQIENKSKELRFQLKLLESKLNDDCLDIKPVNDGLLGQYMFGAFVERLPSFILKKNGPKLDNDPNSTKVYVLFNEMANGYLDQNEWGYMLNSHNHGELDLDKSKVENTYIRWVFIEKDNYFWIQNPKSQRYLSSGTRRHISEKSSVDEGYETEYASWLVEYFVFKDKKYVILKSLKTGQYFTAEGYNKYERGYSNDDGHHMTSFNNGDPRMNPHLRFELSELPLDALNKDNESNSNQNENVENYGDSEEE